MRENRTVLAELAQNVQEISEDFNDSVPVSNAHRRAQTLTSDLTELGEGLEEREREIKRALNRWIDFQALFKELENINSWFEQREEALSKYQSIATQREFEIALQDVKVQWCFCFIRVP